MLVSVVILVGEPLFNWIFNSSFKWEVVELVLEYSKFFEFQR